MKFFQYSCVTICFIAIMLVLIGPLFLSQLIAILGVFPPSQSEMESEGFENGRWDYYWKHCLFAPGTVTLLWLWLKYKFQMYDQSMTYQDITDSKPWLKKISESKNK